MNVLVGHCLDVLAGVPDESADCCVTSPPYWQARDYGDAGQPWPEVAYRPLPGAPEVVSPACTVPLGLEPEVRDYVAHIVAVFREVRKVLSPRGTLWLNLGPSSASAGRGGGGAQAERYATAPRGFRSAPGGYKDKDLVGVPWLVALALQADGWYLRSEVIWEKTNTPPESARDRPTRAHEQVFLLSRSARYYFDQDSVREPHAGPRSSARDGNGMLHGKGQIRPRGTRGAPAPHPGGRNVRSVWRSAVSRFSSAHVAVMPAEIARRCVLAGCPPGGLVIDPFAGAGTSGVAALATGRRFLGIEQRAEYAEIARSRERGREVSPARLPSQQSRQLDLRFPAALARERN